MRRERLRAAGFETVFPDRPTFKEFAVRVGRDAREVIRAARALGVHPGYALGRDYARSRRRAARRRDGEAHAGGHRAPRRGAHRGGGLMELIYEKSSAGRRAGRVPHYDVAEGRGSRRAAPHRAAASSRGDRARARASLHRARRPELRHRHGLLSARLLHDEAQPAGERACRRPAGIPRPPPAAGGRGGPGGARPDVAPAAPPGRDHGPARRLAAARGRARRAS